MAQWCCANYCRKYHQNIPVVFNVRTYQCAWFAMSAGYHTTVIAWCVVTAKCPRQTPGMWPGCHFRDVSRLETTHINLCPRKVSLINDAYLIAFKDSTSNSRMHNTWIRYKVQLQYLLLLISMLWHRQAIFESKGDKLSSSADCRMRTQGLRHQFASKLNARWETYWALEDQAKNSTGCPFDQRALCPFSSFVAQYSLSTAG